MSSLYQRVLGHPFVYNRVRPFVVGGIDWTPLYRHLAAGPGDVILDVGCGTGVAQDYLRGSGFVAYHGYDTDATAIAFARQNAGGSHVEYVCSLVTPADLERIRPTRVVLGGLLHHLSDADAGALLTACARCPSVKRVATSDVVYLPGRHLSNLLAYFDRGKFVRSPAQYLALMRRSGFSVAAEELVRSHPRNGKAWYFMTALVPEGLATADGGGGLAVGGGPGPT
jgi:SAM-dependent methyltransferase